MSYQVKPPLHLNAGNGSGSSQRPDMMRFCAPSDLSGAASEARLGNKRKNVDALRRERWADQRQAANIYRRKAEAEGVNLKSIKGRGVTLCGWTQIANQGGSRLMLVDLGDDHGAKAFWSGLQRCGGVWNCPVCTQAKAEAARISLNLGLAAARSLGLSPVMMTLTARHSWDMSLRDFWDALGTAEQELKRSRAWKRLTGKATKTRPDGPMRRGGFAKAIEVTQSNSSGWHPHAHIICLLDMSEERAIAAIEELRGEWLHQLNRVGLDGTSAAARRRAFDVQGAAQAGNYVAKWGAAEEMTGATKKEGRQGGRSMWQLLRDARTAETSQARQQAEDLWYEAVRVMTGVHQLRMSPAFRALVEEERERTDSEEQQQPEAVEVWRCGLVRHDPTWQHVRWKRLRAIEAAEKAGIAGARDAVIDVVTSPVFDADDLCELENVDVIDDECLEPRSDRIAERLAGSISEPPCVAPEAHARAVARSATSSKKPEPRPAKLAAERPRVSAGSECPAGPRGAASGGRRRRLLG